MAFFVWKDSFSIGIRDVDRQHQGLLELLNEYHEQVIRHGFSGVSPAMLGRLKHYANSHFRDEEALMEFRGYGGLEEHRKQHDYFRSLLADLESGRLQGHAATVEGMLAFLRDWFLKLVLEVYRKIADVLRTAR